MLNFYESLNKKINDLMKEGENLHAKVVALHHVIVASWPIGSEYATIKISKSKSFYGTRMLRN